METKRYQALYRKFRPRTFSEVRGQEAIITTLRNQVRAGRLGHAYLFTGTRGTGKTTVAKILAKAVNCENPVNGDPCLSCPSCLRIDNPANLNVIEMDAASNNGVGDVRQIIEEIVYPPAEGKFKVYIIDEVHMFSPAAFNALLKTLEEPPSYVVFILATTDPHKVPITILSRCQRYDFRRIGQDVIASQLEGICLDEGIEAEGRALDYIARKGDGSMRDALSLLERCSNYHAGKKLTYEMALEVLGAVDIEVYARLFQAISRGDVSECMRVVEDVLLQGREIAQFTTDFIQYIRNLLMLRAAEGASSDVVDLNQEAFAAMTEQARHADVELLIRYVRVLSQLSDDLRFATQKRIRLEIALIKLCRPQMERDEAALLGRIKQLEDKLIQLEDDIAKRPAGKVIQVVQNAAEIGSEAGRQPEKREKKPLPEAVPEQIKKMAGEDWDKVLALFEEPLRGNLRKAVPAYKDGKLILAYEIKPETLRENQRGQEFPDAPIFLTRVKKSKEQIEEKLSVFLGGKVEIDFDTYHDKADYEQKNTLLKDFVDEYVNMEGGKVLETEEGREIIF
ncbi:MAG: DNA polymerase III subunit gamma/tau [Lachnospiraceae bacterium]|nr:DNA polymerase III subunit gamma/tau [Lachnospiraceae bacterium]